MQVKRLTITATLPTRATPGSAGLDVYADEVGTLLPGERRLVRTGIAVAIPEGYEGQLRPRSGLAHKHGVTILNAPGTIDSDYRGEVMVNLYHTGSTHERLDRVPVPFTFERGDRIAQLVVCPVFTADVVEVDWLDDTVRGVGGHGSTGR